MYPWQVLLISPTLTNWLVTRIEVLTWTDELKSHFSLELIFWTPFNNDFHLIIPLLHLPTPRSGIHQGWPFAKHPVLWKLTPAAPTAFTPASHFPSQPHMQFSCFSFPCSSCGPSCGRQLLDSSKLPSWPPPLAALPKFDPNSTSSHSSESFSWLLLRFPSLF